MSVRLSRYVLVFALVIGFGFLSVLDLSEPRVPMLIWKGAGVGLLALYAAMNARDAAGWLLTAVLALGSLGDVLVEVQLELGGASFALAWIVGIVLYRRFPRTELSDSQKGLAVSMILLVPVIGWILTREATAAAYCLVIAIMAACAWVSRFPRYRVGVGAVMLVVSDLFLFGRAGPYQFGGWSTYAVWITYFGGQVMVATGAVASLRRWHAYG